MYTKLTQKSDCGNLRSVVSFKFSNMNFCNSYWRRKQSHVHIYIHCTLTVSQLMFCVLLLFAQSIWKLFTVLHLFHSFSCIKFIHSFIKFNLRSLANFTSHAHCNMTGFSGLENSPWGLLLLKVGVTWKCYRYRCKLILCEAVKVKIKGLRR